MTLAVSVILSFVGVSTFLAALAITLFEGRGMYFRLFTRYYYNPRIGERMNIVKMGYDKDGQIAILEGIGLTKSYAMHCAYLPNGSAAGTEEVFVYRQEFPLFQKIYRYGAMETELLAAGRAVDDSVTVVKGAKRIESDDEWRSLGLAVNVLRILARGCLGIYVIVFFVCLVSGADASMIVMAVFGILALALKLSYKAENQGPALRVYTDISQAPPEIPEDAIAKAARRAGIDDNERRAFLREKERREIFEKMNPMFNKFYAELKASVENPPVPPAENDVLTAAAKAEMDRVCFAVTAHPQTKAEAVSARRQAKAKKQSCDVASVAGESAHHPNTETDEGKGAAGGVCMTAHTDSDASTMEAPVDAEKEGVAAGKDADKEVEYSDTEYSETSCARASDGEEITVEAVDEEQVKQLHDKAAVSIAETIVLGDFGVEIDEAAHQPAAEARVGPAAGPETDHEGNGDSANPCLRGGYSDVLQGTGVICRTCGGICKAPEAPDWVKMKCPECGAAIKRSRVM